MLRCDFFPVCLTRMLNDQVVYFRPQWITLVSELVSGKTIAVIDEIVIQERLYPWRLKKF
jgi:hypothetical protein